MNEPWDSKKPIFLASYSRSSFLSQEASSRSWFFWLPACFLSFLALRLLGRNFLAQEAAYWKLASGKPKKRILEAKKTSFLKSSRSHFLKSKKLVFWLPGNMRNQDVLVQGNENSAMSVKRKSFTVDEDAWVAVMKGCMTEAQARAWPLDPKEACKGYAFFVKQYLSMGEHTKPETRAS